MKCEKFKKRLFEKNNAAYMGPLYYLHTIFCKDCRKAANMMNSVELAVHGKSCAVSHVEVSSIMEVCRSFESEKNKKEPKIASANLYSPIK